MAAVNPYLDPGPFGSCTIGDAPLAGVITAINGVERVEDITFQKGTSGNNAVTIWNGSKLVEDAELTIRLHTSEQYAQHEVVRRTLRPKMGEQPPSLPIVNAIFNSEGVVTVIVRMAPPPLWVQGGNYWVAKIKLAEFKPAAPARAGQATPAQYTQGAPPKTAAEKEFERLAKEAASL